MLMWLISGGLQVSGYLKWMESLGAETTQDTVKLLRETKDPQVLGLMAFAAVVAAPGRLIAWSYAGSTSRAFTSTDGGATWDTWADGPIEEQPEVLRRITAAYGGGGIV